MSENPNLGTQHILDRFFFLSVYPKTLISPTPIHYVKNKSDSTHHMGGEKRDFTQDNENTYIAFLRLILFVKGPQSISPLSCTVSFGAFLKMFRKMKIE